MDIKDVEDRVCVEKTLCGDKKAFEKLVKRYQASIFNIAYRMTGSREDAKDLTQETFLRAYSKLDSFHIARRFSPWLFRIASNLCINWQNRQKLHPVSLESLIEDKKEQSLLADISKEPFSHLEKIHVQKLLQQEILNLPAKYRLVFTLRYLDNHSCREIANILEMPEGTVKTYLFKARRILKEKLRDIY